MSLNEKINAVYPKAISEQWTYPQLFDALKNEGVRSYKVDVAAYWVEYSGDQEQVVHEGPKGFTATVGVFDQSGVIAAIRRTQRRETDYPTFLKEIAASGIAAYRVDMKERTVSYLGQDPANRYVENVP